MGKIEEILKTIFKRNESKIKERLLGGMMNETYIVTSLNRDYVLYIPQGNANDVVDRDEEKYIQSIISSLGITSKNVYFDTKSGIKCHEFIPGISLNKIEEFDYEKIAKMLKVFHSSKKLSHYYYEPFKKIDGYINEVKSFTTLTDDFLTLINELKKFQHYLESQDICLCHNDFQRSNIVKSNDEYFVIDFEFAANNDPVYDIAGFGNNKVEEGFNLLNHYFKNPTLDQKKRYYLWRMFISLQWALVALIKDNNGEGKIHNYDFKEVSNFFLANGMEAYKLFKNL